MNISFISNALVASTKIFIDKYVGLYEEILSYPVRRSHILFGKLIFNLILSFAQAVVMIAFVAAITGNIELNWYRIILLVLVLALGSSTWFFSMVILAVKLKTQDAFNTAYFLIMTPIVFTSSIYYPVNRLPSVLKFLGYANPLSWMTDIGRDIYLGVPTSELSLKVIGLVALLIISSIMSIRMFAKGIK